MNIISFLSFAQYENIVEIDRITGNHIHSGPLIAGVTLVPGNIRSYDENNGIFFFPSTTPTDRLFSIDVTNDSILHNPVFNTNNVTEIEYGNSFNTLYGLYRDQPNNFNYLVSINPITGNFNTIGNPISVAGGMFQGFSAFNQNNNIYTIVLTL